LIDVQKLIFVFGRKPGLSHDEFARHYLEVHAPLGRRVTRAMAGYVVNLVEQADERDSNVPELDAITEIWTPSVEEFFDPAHAFTSPEDGRELMADHDSFIGPMHAYLVSEELVEPADGTALSRFKHVALVGPQDGATPDASARDNVVRVLTPDAPDVTAFAVRRLATPQDGGRLGLVSGYFVSEHVMLTPGGAGRAR
jgi:uncharacterized protein (TIGR02118 family)